MEEFPDLRDKEAAQLKDFEMRIPKLLEHMSSQIARSTALPSKQEVKDKQDQMNYNENLVENAEETIVRIRMELETRQSDLEKIKNLEVKIEKENQAMNEKLEKMEDEMNNKFPNVNKLKNSIESDKVDMQKMKAILSEVQPGLGK